MAIAWTCIFIKITNMYKKFKSILLPILNLVDFYGSNEKLRKQIVLYIILNVELVTVNHSSSSSS